MKKWFKGLLAAPAALFGFGAYAAEGNAIDVTAATDALDQMQSALSSYWTAAQPIIMGVLGIALVIFLIFLGWKLFKRATNKA